MVHGCGWLLRCHLSINGIRGYVVKKGYWLVPWKTTLYDYSLTHVRVLLRTLTAPLFMSFYTHMYNTIFQVFTSGVIQNRSVPGKLQIASDLRMQPTPIWSI